MSLRCLPDEAENIFPKRREPRGNSASRKKGEVHPANIVRLRACLRCLTHIYATVHVFFAHGTCKRSHGRLVFIGGVKCSELVRSSRLSVDRRLSILHFLSTTIVTSEKSPQQGNRGKPRELHGPCTSVARCGPYVVSRVCVFV